MSQPGRTENTTTVITSYSIVSRHDMLRLNKQHSLTAFVWTLPDTVILLEIKHNPQATTLHSLPRYIFPRYRPEILLRERSVRRPLGAHCGAQSETALEVKRDLGAFIPALSPAVTSVPAQWHGGIPNGRASVRITVTTVVSLTGKQFISIQYSSTHEHQCCQKPSFEHDNTAGLL